MNKVCEKCRNNFEITEKDVEFYKKIDVPEPKLCPQCRMRARLMFRNERRLYGSKCALCGKNVITAYNPSYVKFPIYCSDCWWSDKWDPLKYGVDFDFDKPFFEQLSALANRVPHQAVHSNKNLNSDYTHCTSYLKNCYLMFGANFNEDCFYGNSVNRCKDVCDSWMATDSELLYECIECDHCYNLNFSKNCRSCSESSFLFNCRNCQKCFGCVNLFNKSYCIFNKEFSKVEYEKEMKKYQLLSQKKIDEIFKFVQKHIVKFPQKYMIGENNENVTGDFVMHSKNALNCFDATDLEDCSYCMWLHDARDCYDIYAWGFAADLCYFSVEVGDNAYNSLFCISCYGCTDILYSMFAMYSKNLFGCVGVKKANRCILNKQYSEKEYSNLKNRIIEYMKKTDEWGKFFPDDMAIFPYEDSLASDYFPL